MTRRIMILGATSAIAEQTARLFAAQGDSLFLVARNAEKLDTLVKDLSLRGAAQTGSLSIDLNEREQHVELCHLAYEELGGLDILFIAYGTLADQKACEQDFSIALHELNNNCLSVLSLLTEAANFFEQQGQGIIAVISSVAGDRGRQSNYVYGTAKGALTLFLQGLRNRLSKLGVSVMTIKPGFVDTPMTSEFNKGLLWVGPETIAKGIVKAINKKKDVVYLPFFWRYIMLIIKLIPERIFKKLSL